MENISLEQIDLIMQRANVTYNEAKEALEKCNGNTVEALILLEKEEKIKDKTSSSCKDDSFKTQFKSFINKLNATRFIMKKDDACLVDIPLSIALIAIIFCFYISIIGLIVAYCCGVKIEIKGNNDVADKINQNIDLCKH